MRYFLIILFSLIAPLANSLTLKPDAPKSYVVQPGDSLWEIANRYLEHPWEWRSLWHSNNIKNPNLIFPGAVIELHYLQNKPYLKVLSNGTIKLSPAMRPRTLDEPIPPIPLSDIRPFLNASLILDHDVLADAPYIVAFTTEHMLGGQGDQVYVKDLCPKTNLASGVTPSYAIFREGNEYYSPRTKNFLGYKATLVGYAELLQPGDPAKILLTDIMEGVRLRDRVMPNNQPGFDLTFEPKAPDHKINSAIIDLPGSYTQGAVGLVVIIEGGKDIGIEAGDVLAIYSRSRRVQNPECPPDCVRIPPERIGELMVFRTFTHTSFGLVVRSIRAIRQGDKVTNP